MNKVLKHALLPLLAPLILLALYFTPKEVFGCANRGLMALGVVLVAALLALFSAVKFKLAIDRHDPDANWWMLTTLILVLAIALLFGPLA